MGSLRSMLVARAGERRTQFQRVVRTQPDGSITKVMIAPLTFARSIARSAARLDLGGSRVGGASTSIQYLGVRLPQPPAAGVAAAQPGPHPPTSWTVAIPPWAGKTAKVTTAAPTLNRPTALRTESPAPPGVKTGAPSPITKW